MNIPQHIIDKARTGNAYACGYLYARTEGDPVKLTELGEDIATAVSNALDDAYAAVENYDDEWVPVVKAIPGAADLGAPRYTSTGQ